jgi:hypothetical protein
VSCFLKYATSSLLKYQVYCEEGLHSFSLSFPVQHILVLWRSMTGTNSNHFVGVNYLNYDVQLKWGYPCFTDIMWVLHGWHLQHTFHAIIHFSFGAQKIRSRTKATELIS